MKEPSVCCVCLVNGREKMVARAIKSFREQAYERKRLLIWDTGENRQQWDYGASDILCPDVATELIAGAKVGELRNYANLYASHHYVKSEDRPEFLCHFDSDDWSHPSRLIEQVALLEMTGKECVGYSDMLFWEETPGHFCGAWLWNNLDKRHPIGTSLMYKRSAWERVPFLALPNKAGATGEEYNWLKQVDALGVSSLPDFHGEKEKRPRMIASIHGANTQYYDPAEYVEHNRGTSWKRTTEWDAHCREVMAF